MSSFAQKSDSMKRFSSGGRFESWCGITKKACSIKAALNNYHSKKYLFHYLPRVLLKTTWTALPWMCFPRPRVSVLETARLLLFAYHYRMPSKPILLAAKLACFVFVEALLLFPQLPTEVFAHCVLSKASFLLFGFVSIYALFDQFLVRASNPYPPCTLWYPVRGESPTRIWLVHYFVYSYCYWLDLCSCVCFSGNVLLCYKLYAFIFGAIQQTIPFTGSSCW